MHDWWTAQDAANFKAKADMFAAFFDAIEVLPGLHANGEADGLKVIAADIGIKGSSVDDIGELMWGLDDEYDAVSISVSRDGKLIYLSPSVLELTGIASPDTPDEKDDCASLPAIRDIVTAAKGLDLRTSCIYGTVPQVLGDGEDAEMRLRIDLAVIGELSGAGFDEIVVGGLVDDGEKFDFETLSSVIGYLASVRSVSGDTDIGVILPAEVYLDAPTASQIATLKNYTDLLAIEVSSGEASTAEEAYDSVEENYYNLKGNFSAHNLRAIITSSDGKTAFGAYRALKDLSVDNVQFCAYVPEPSAPLSQPQSAETPAETGNWEEKTNENAMTGEKYTDTEQETESPEDTSGD